LNRYLLICCGSFLHFLNHLTFGTILELANIKLRRTGIPYTTRRAHSTSNLNSLTVNFYNYVTRKTLPSSHCFLSMKFTLFCCDLQQTKSHASFAWNKLSFSYLFIFFCFSVRKLNLIKFLRQFILFRI
jgi:hypothetical protein